jgi:hypothetical protein
MAVTTSPCCYRWVVVSRRPATVVSEMVSLRRYPLAVSAAFRAEPVGRLAGVAAGSVRREAHPLSTTKAVSSVALVAILRLGFTLSAVLKSGSPLIIPAARRRETTELEVLLVEHPIAQQ